jgi:hypothetical protein
MGNVVLSLYECSRAGPRMALVWGGFAMVVGGLAIAQAVVKGAR